MNAIVDEIKKRNEEEIFIKPLNLAARTLVYATETFFDKTFFKPNKKFFDIQKLATAREQIGKEITATHNGIVYKFEVKKPKKRTLVADCSKREKTFFGFENIHSEIKHFYKILPWIQDDINDVYVRPLNEETKDLVLTKHSLTDASGRQYFKPNKKYYEVQSQSKKKRQCKEEFSMVYDNIQYKMNIGIVTNGGLVIQNEKIFRAETEFLNAWRTSDKTKEMKALMEGPASDAVFYSAKQLLTQSLKNENKVAFVESIVEEYKKHFASRTETFISNILDLIVFIDPQLGFIRETVFSKRIRGEGNYYKPSILPFLTPSEKLEEIYGDPKIPTNTLDYVNDHIIEKKNKMRDNWVQMLLMAVSLGIKRDTRKTVAVTKAKPKIVDLPPWKTVCKNFREIEHETDENLLFYREDSDVYGFTITDMFKIIQTTGINPYTKNAIPFEYMQRFLDTFHPTKTDNSRENKPMVTDDELTENILAALLENQLSLLEKVCFECKKGPTKKEYEIFRDEGVLSFCSKECYRKNREQNNQASTEGEDNNFSMLF